MHLLFGPILYKLAIGIRAGLNTHDWFMEMENTSSLIKNIQSSLNGELSYIKTAHNS